MFTKNICQAPVDVTAATLTMYTQTGSRCCDRVATETAIDDRAIAIPIIVLGFHIRATLNNHATLVLVLIPDVMESPVLVLGCRICAVLNERASDVYLSPS